MNAQTIRQSYLEFFKNHNHKVIPRALLVPQNDPTTLFTGSGMQPLIPYLLGEQHPEGTRLVDSQTSFRAGDIEEVGDNRHTTFFEMLGNWSLGDYFKQEQLPYFFEFLTDVLKLDPNKLYVTCFIGSQENNIPKDEESAGIWQRLFKDKGIDAQMADIGSEASGYKRGIKPGERVFFYDASKNWWCRAGKIEDMPAGEPGGPDSEVFYRFYERDHDDVEKQQYGELCHPNCDCGQFMEIGNSVFMEYVKTDKGFDKLPKRNVDFGGGLERLAAAERDDPDVFHISILWPIIEKLEALSGKQYDSHKENMRVIADHLRGATFLAVDGVVPSNKAQGYVMRRLIRRAVRYAFALGVEQNFVQEVVPVITDLYEADYPEIKASRDRVIEVLVKEEKVFRQTLRNGLRVFEKLTLAPSEYQRYGVVTGSTPIGEMTHVPMKELTGEDIFLLYDTYGFPVELSLEEAYKRTDVLGIVKNWREQFEGKMAEQRARSQTATRGDFKGGLGGHTLQHKKYHTATHLLQSALRQLFGSDLHQHGSNITEERLRFDFNHDAKVTPEEIKKLEDLVNGWIGEDLPVKFTEYPTKQALDMGAIGPFGERYGEVVKVYQMGPDDHIVSLEICGGPHVDHTGQLSEDGKHFKIIKEESSSAGIRRIKAVLQ